MIVLHFAEYASGGVSTYLKDLIKFQCSQRTIRRVYLLVSDFKTDTDLLSMTDNKLTIIPYKYTRSLLGILKILKQSFIIKQINPDVVHIHSSFAGLIRIMFMFSSFKRKVLYCSHGWAFNREINSLKRDSYKLLEWFLSFGCSKIVNISKFELKSANFISNSKMVMIYNSIPDIESPVLTEREELPIKLLFVGRLDRQKGIDLLLDAFSTLNSDKFKLTIVGKSIVSKNNLKKRYPKADFVGWKDSNEIRSYIDNCDVLVVPSRWEGFGLVSLEAMRRGRMVVASDAGALPEIVDSGRTGIVFKSRSIDAIRNTLVQLEGFSQDDFLTFGSNGRNRFLECFNYDDMVRRLMNVYRDIQD